MEAAARKDAGKKSGVVVHFGRHPFNGTQDLRLVAGANGQVTVVGPFGHGFIIQPNLFVAEQFGQDEPGRRRMEAFIAICDDLAIFGDSFFFVQFSKFGRRLECPVFPEIVFPQNIDGARNVAELIMCFARVVDLTRFFTGILSWWATVDDRDARFPS
jgi:hypothetical protein